MVGALWIWFALGLGAVVGFLAFALFHRCERHATYGDAEDAAEVEW